MKIIRELNEENKYLSKTYLQLSEGETVVPSWLFDRESELDGELYIPEGIEEIKDRAFSNRVCYHTFYFPKSLKKPGDSLFSMYTYKIKVVYAGNSADFMALAAPWEQSVYERDGYDRYPYYSGGSRWVTYYYAFDRASRNVEVYCAEDGVTLLYGKDHREDDQPPKIKSEEE